MAATSTVVDVVHQAVKQEERHADAVNKQAQETIKEVQAAEKRIEEHPPHTTQEVRQTAQKLEEENKHLRGELQNLRMEYNRLVNVETDLARVKKESTESSKAISEKLEAVMGNITKLQQQSDVVRREQAAIVVVPERQDHAVMTPSPAPGPAPLSDVVIDEEIIALIKSGALDKPAPMTMQKGTSTTEGAIGVLHTKAYAKQNAQGDVVVTTLGDLDVISFTKSLSPEKRQAYRERIQAIGIMQHKASQV